MKGSTMAYAQPIRAVSLVSTIICLPFAIAAAAVSVVNERSWYYRHRNATTLCFTFFPLAMTATLSVASFLYLRKNGKALGSRIVPYDLLTGLTYLAILLPIWIRELRELERPGYVLVASYTTFPMMINMCLHFSLVLACAKEFLMTKSWFRRSAIQCSNCQATINFGVPQEVRQASKGEGYSLLRGEDYLDEDAVTYKDTRESNDLLNSEGADVDDGEAVGKGKIILDV